jgi:hypothetical protein
LPRMPWSLEALSLRGIKFEGHGFYRLQKTLWLLKGTGFSPYILTTTNTGFSP